MMLYIISSIFLPLISIIFFLKVDKKYFYIYILNNILLSLIIINFNLSLFLFDLFPSLLIGLFISIMIKKNINLYSNLYFSSILIFILEILSIFIYDKITSINTLNTIMLIYKIENNKLNIAIIFFILSIYSILKINLILLTIKSELIKFKIKYTYKESNLIILMLSLSINIILTLLFINLNLLELTFISISFLIYNSILLIIKKFKRNDYILFVIIIIVSWIVYVYLLDYQLTIKPINILLLPIIFINLVSCIKFKKEGENNDSNY